MLRLHTFIYKQNCFVLQNGPILTSSLTFVVATLRLKDCPISDRGKKEEKDKHQDCWDQGYAHQLGTEKKIEKFGDY